MRTNPPAFPMPAVAGFHGPEFGMSLRDWFAGQALSGIIASHADSDMPLPSASKTAQWAYDYADALLAARNTIHVVPQDRVPPDRLAADLAAVRDGTLDPQRPGDSEAVV